MPGETPEPEPPAKEAGKAPQCDRHKIAEIGRIYRLIDNGQLNPAVAARKVSTLVAFARWHAGGGRRTAADAYVPTVVNVLAVPSNFFLSHDQIEAYKNGETIIDVNKCEPLVFDPLALTKEAPVIAFTPPKSLPRPAPDVEPAPVLDPVMQRAMEMGYTPLPPRARPVD